MIPAVSIVMATKNYARFLPEAIESVRAQTFADWELVVIDDGSTDDTPAIVSHYLTDARIRYFRSDRLGQTRAKNLGIRMSRAQLIAFLDADDVWLPSKLEKQLALFRASPETGVVFCRRSLIDDAGNPLPPRPTSTPCRGRVLDQLFVQNFICFSSTIMRREILSHIGLLDPQLDLAIDYDLWLRAAKHYTFDFVDEQLVKYRTGHGNLSNKLADRVNIALSIMQRAELRYGVGEEVPADQIAEGYASTCRTLGYMLRGSEPISAAQWYLKAITWPANRFSTLKGLFAVALRMFTRLRVAGSAENAAVNR
jgi:glycosyltransferase involved in cell wall biosynthesis